jgi:spermidine/putrescine transport system permease protein
LSAVIDDASRRTAEGTKPPPVSARRRRLKGKFLPIYSGVVIFYLVLPILIMILYGFNKSSAHKPVVNFNWQGFTLDWYRNLNYPGLTSAFKLSLILATVSSIVAAAIGTLLALALVRYRFWGKGLMEQVMFLNIAAPEIVLGASLLGFFVQINLARGFVTLFLAHVMFSVAYVAITVRARLSGFDRSLEEAAQDLGANGLVTFGKVTLPLIWPGVLAGGLMAFALSIDDFVTSNFVAGSAQTFPLWVYGAVKVGIPPQVFVFGTLIFVAGLSIAIVNLLLNQRRKARLPA